MSALFKGVSDFLTISSTWIGRQKKALCIKFILIHNTDRSLLDTESSLHYSSNRLPDPLINSHTRFLTIESLMIWSVYFLKTLCWISAAGKSFRLFKCVMFSIINMYMGFLKIKFRLQFIVQLFSNRKNEISHKNAIFLSI